MESELRRNASLTNDELNALFAAAWVDHTPRGFQPVLAKSLTYITAHTSAQLIGFVNVVGDGGSHAFVLDPTVHPQFQRQGIGRQLLREAAVVARENGVEWLHVDFVRELEAFYRKAGFRATRAGVMALR